MTRPKPASPRGSQGPSRVIPHQPTKTQHVAAALISGLARLIGSTIRFEWHDETDLFVPGDPSTPVIFSGWHNRIALCLIAFQKYAMRRQPDRRLAALASASRDGALTARVLEHFGVQPVRGSTSRRGLQALNELASLARKGYDIGVTPDGPRGPRYRVQMGIVALAQLTGHPILPMSCRVSRKRCLQSWDQFQIPLPFARCEVWFSKPVYVRRTADPHDRLAICHLIEEKMMATTRD